MENLECKHKKINVDSKSQKMRGKPRKLIIKKNWICKLNPLIKKN